MESGSRPGPLLSPPKPVNTSNTTTIQHLTNGQGINALAALTGAQIAYSDQQNTISLHFPKMVGKAGGKFKTLEIALNGATDLYDLKAYKLNRKTFQVEVKGEMGGCFCEQLNEVAEAMTGLCLRF